MLRSRFALGLFAAAAAALATLPAQAASPPPPFDVAYRAWDAVQELSRLNGRPALTGECGRTFRPVSVPALRRQTRQEQDAAATACVEAARQACADAKLRRTRETAAKCQEFR